MGEQNVGEMRGSLARACLETGLHPAKDGGVLMMSWHLWFSWIR